MNTSVSAELTTRLKHLITSVDGDTEYSTINSFVDNMLSRDSLFLRNKIAEITPDIELVQMIELGGKQVEVNIPMTVNFFWPES